MRVITYIIVTLCGILAVIGLIGSTLPEQESDQDEVVVRQKPIEVWNRLVQPDSMKQWRSSIQYVQPHSRFALQEGWIERDHLGTSQVEVIEWSEPRFLVLEIKSSSLPWTSRRVFELQETGEGTLVRMKEVRRTSNPYVRFARLCGFRQKSVTRELSGLLQLFQ